MKIYFNIILFCIFSVSCNAQNTEFSSYMSNFGQTKLPVLIVDRQSRYLIFDQRYDSIFGKTYKMISEKLVEKFICKGDFCISHAGYFRYDYGVRLDFCQKYSAVLVSKLQYEGKTEWDFDLAEILLLIYNNNGEILSRQSLTKDNDRWKSRVKITKEGISVMQIKITEPEMNKVKGLHCEVWTTEYQIAEDGVIKIIGTSPVATGIVIWNESIEDYKLKE